MKLVANLIPLVAGGGQRVGLNFILGMTENKCFGHEVHYFVTRGSVLEKELINRNISEYTSVDTSGIKRVFFEMVTSRRVFSRLRPDVIYTIFGYSFFSKRFLQVSGVAYSNLFFPEIDFWVEYSGVARFKRKLIDFYRTYGLKRAQALIFENPAMEKRAHSLWSYNTQRTTYIPPSIHSGSKEHEASGDGLEKKPFNILMLCGWQRNKNIHLVPEIAAEAKSRGVDVHFIITIGYDGTDDSQLFLEKVNNYGVEDMISLIGQVPPSEVPNLYLMANAVMLISKLESFSNNIIEAWTYGIPLIITDHDWARDICGEAAFYVDRDNPVNIVDTVAILLNERSQIMHFRTRAVSRLKNYPSIGEKIKLELEFINHVINDV